jgi:RNA polymerase sigma-70 factor, ECF subfamily
MKNSAESLKPAPETHETTLVMTPDASTALQPANRRIKIPRRKSNPSISSLDVPTSQAPTVIFVGDFSGAQREIQVKPDNPDTSSTLRAHDAAESNSNISQQNETSVKKALRDNLGMLERPETVMRQSKLVQEAKAGDKDAFTQLYKETQADVYTLAHRLTGNEEDTKDVTQEAYMRAYGALKRFRGDAEFSTWMYRITANTAYTHLRLHRGKRNHDELKDSDNIIDNKPDSDPESMAEGTDLRDKVNLALADLPPILRAVVILRDVYDLPHDAIAKELEISEAAAKVRLYRARKKLKEKLFPTSDEDAKANDRTDSKE